VLCRTPDKDRPLRNSILSSPSPSFVTGEGSATGNVAYAESSVCEPSHGLLGAGSVLNDTEQKAVEPLLFESALVHRQTMCRTYARGQMRHLNEGHVMTWDSDGKWVLIYSILVTLFMLSWVYVPA
jgi:hypothetical protein